MILGTRILILGDTGSGKTTLAKDLSIKLALPFHDLDDIYWEKKYTLVRMLPMRLRMLLRITDTENWVIAGIPSDWNESALFSAQHIILIKRTRIAETLRVIHRFLKGKRAGQSPNKLWTLASTVYNKFLPPSKTRILLAHIKKQYSHKIIIFQSEKQIRQFARNVKKQT